MTKTDELTLLADHVNDRLKDMLDEKCDMFDELMKAILSLDGMDFVCITGYTPSFNDGDPCMHTSLIGLNSFVDCDGDGEEYCIAMGIEVTDENVENGLAVIDNTPDLERSVLDAIYALENDAICNRYVDLYDNTNYRAIIKLVNDKLVVSVDYYEPSY